jgi:putative transposase
MGVQISCGFHPEIPQESDFRRDQEACAAESKIEEGHLTPDHVHMLISIPPKYSVAEVIGFMKGKSSIWIAQNVERKARNFTGHKFWARGYFVSTVGRDEETIRAYIKNQEMQDRELDQLSMIP